MACAKQQVETSCWGIWYRYLCVCWFSATYAGVLTAGALEYKDKAYGGNWDWIDFGLTVVGTCVGQLVRTIV